MSNTTKKSNNGAAIIIVGILFAIWHFWPAHVPTPEEKAADAARAQEDAAKKAEDHRKGFDCLSGWDGSYRKLVDQVKDDLRDPSSFEHIETSITPADGQDQHTVFMKFRAKNGFGGMNVGAATATLRGSDCGLINWNMISD